MSGKIRVLLVDDNSDFLALASEVLSPDFEVVAVVTEPRNLNSAIQEFAPQVVVLDVNLPNLSGVAAAKALSKSSPGLGIVLTSASPGRIYERNLASIGAHAYVDKLQTTSELPRAVSLAFSASRRHE